MVFFQRPTILASLVATLSRTGLNSEMAAIKFGSHIKELRILLCQTSKSSEGVRNFIEKQYVPLKKSNPNFPVLIRECSLIEPRLYARYEYGVERCVPLSDLKSEEIFERLKHLVTVKP